MNKKVKAFWDSFLIETGRDQKTECKEVFAFGHTEKMANELLELVMAGKKSATTSAFPEYEILNEKLPQIGDLSIVTDWNGIPKCVIETTIVSKLKFKDMTFNICKREGEDENLESWQNKHIYFFTEVDKKLGYEFSWDMDIIFDDFKVIY